MCGDPAPMVCFRCGAPTCGSCAQFWVDESNIAITRNAKPECRTCRPPQHPRPYTLTRALAEDEFDLDVAVRLGLLGVVS